MNFFGRAFFGGAFFTFAIVSSPAKKPKKKGKQPLAFSDLEAREVLEMKVVPPPVVPAPIPMPAANDDDAILIALAKAFA